MKGRAYTIVGLMSGTSLDGVDLAICRFTESEGNWQYSFEHTLTEPYSRIWRQRLQESSLVSGLELKQIDRDYGRYLGQLVNGAIKVSGIKADLVASHGHTVFHRPEKGYTLQIGSGADIAATTDLPVICDFRSLDVALGGQGAPLVPVGDKLLFNQYNACLNLGGFSNISFDRNEVRCAFDICPVNILLNDFARKKGREYDRDGEMGKAGSLDHKLFEKMNSLAYYQLDLPKSLSKEWVEQHIHPLLVESDISENDRLTTIYHHIAWQLSETFRKYDIKSVLLTGGGTYNKFLLGLLKKYTNISLEIPDKQLIDFKEALIFAFLGLLRNLGITNCYASVTGARSDSLGGIIYNK